MNSCEFRHYDTLLESDRDERFIFTLTVHGSFKTASLLRVNADP